MALLRVISGLVLALALSGGASFALPPPAEGLPSVESLAPADAEGGPDVIWYETRVWGTIRYTWRIERGGEGRLRSVNQPESVFPVSEEDFDRIHRIVRYGALTSRPSRNCRPGPTDGPYGAIHWRIDGRVRELSWSSGYFCSNSEFIYARLDDANLAVAELARRSQDAPQL